LIPPREALLSQGDIFRRRFVFPFSSALDENFQIVRDDATVPDRLAQDAWEGGKTEVVLLPSHATDLGIVLSNSCDADNDEGKDPVEFVLLGAILPIDAIPDANNRRNCQRNKIQRYHHLEPFEDARLAESYVHFGLVTLVDQEELVRAKDARIAAMRSPYLESLGHRFGEFFSRVAVP
jgi:hypothetical protein